MIASFSHAGVPDLLQRLQTQLLSVSLHKPENVYRSSPPLIVMDASQIPVLAGLVICDPQIPQMYPQSPIHMEKLDTTLGALQMVPDGNKEEACRCHLVLLDIAPFRLARV